MQPWQHDTSFLLCQNQGHTPNGCTLWSSMRCVSVLWLCLAMMVRRSRRCPMLNCLSSHTHHPLHPHTHSPTGEAIFCCEKLLGCARRRHHGTRRMGDRWWAYRPVYNSTCTLIISPTGETIFGFADHCASMRPPGSHPMLACKVCMHKVCVCVAGV